MCEYIQYATAGTEEWIWVPDEFYGWVMKPKWAAILFGQEVH